MARRWATTDGKLLVEGQPQETTWGDHDVVTFMEAAHVYELRDPKTGHVLETYRGGSRDVYKFGGPCILDRYLVEGDRLVRREFWCREDEIYGTPSAEECEGQRRVVLSGLQPLARDRTP